MKLGVDARMMYGAWKHRGIGRYTASILAPVSNDDLTLFFPKNQSIELGKVVSGGNGFFPWWEQVIFPMLVKRESLDYLLCPSITSPVISIPKVKKIIVIYDLIFMQSFSELPISHSLYNNLGRLYRRFTAPKSYSSADILISISEYSRDELYEKCGVPKEKVHVIPCSITNDWFLTTPVPAKDREKYLLTVSGDSPSKNLPRLLEAFAKICNMHNITDFKLRIVGVALASHDFFNKKVASLGISDYVVFEKFVAEDELQQLYRNAWASLSLSLYEGFGIPIVEAMASGTPIVCSNTTSLPEVAGNVAIYSNPRDVENIASAIMSIIHASEEKRDQMGLHGLERAKIFSESAVLEIIKKFWEKLI